MGLSALASKGVPVPRGRRLCVTSYFQPPRSTAEINRLKKRQRDVHGDRGKIEIRGLFAQPSSIDAALMDMALTRMNAALALIDEALALLDAALALMAAALALMNNAFALIDDALEFMDDVVKLVDDTLKLMDASLRAYGRGLGAHGRSSCAYERGSWRSWPRLMFS